MSTYSGSGSSGATSARPVSATGASRPPVRPPVQVEHLQQTGRRLRDEAVVDVLVALVLDHDRRVPPVGATATESGCPPDRDRAHDRGIVEVETTQLAGRCRRTRRRSCHGDHERPPAVDGDARRRAGRSTRRAPAGERVADVDDAETLGEGVGVERCGRRGDVGDLGRRGRRDRLAGGQVVGDEERPRGWNATPRRGSSPRFSAAVRSAEAPTTAIPTTTPPTTHARPRRPTAPIGPSRQLQSTRWILQRRGTTGCGGTTVRRRTDEQTRQRLHRSERTSPAIADVSTIGEPLDSTLRSSLGVQLPCVAGGECRRHGHHVTGQARRRRQGTSRARSRRRRRTAGRPSAGGSSRRRSRRAPR